MNGVREVYKTDRCKCFRWENSRCRMLRLDPDYQSTSDGKQCKNREARHYHSGVNDRQIENGSKREKNEENETEDGKSQSQTKRNHEEKSR